MTTIGFIGLGVMGGPMAANLVAAGFDVIGYNRSPAKVQALIDKGGRGAASIAEAVRDADVVITMLPDSPDVEDAVIGAVGVLAGARPRLLLIDMSTIRPDVSRRIAAAGAQKGVRVLDAPVSGGEAAAIEGTLSIMVGGDTADVADAKHVFEAVGLTIAHVGAHGAGQIVKAANQLIVAGNIGLLAEALIFLDSHGVDLDPAVRVLGGGLAGSTVLERKAPGMLAGNFAPGFRLALQHKDLGIVTAAAREAGVVIPLGATVAQMVAALVARGDSDLDHSGLLKLVSELSGRPLST
ncbi:NAD(P)-dependent oxidoreductase [Pseudonocardia nigra]|uniref:NAD(P)-dependent oxidoreductase n=1 Tax=Pseudonocardia nigra TaxID=1921578 RepID=UPI001C5DE67A|nr:NAD(P)-binding domain-containing protein [Pseudonocardia nigra]